MYNINNINDISNSNSNSNSNSYINVVEKNINESKDTVDTTNYNSGWTVITKDKTTGKTIFMNNSNKSKESNKNKNKNKNKNNTKYLEKMIENWNAFRDYDIEVLGDRSIYYNYKEELEKMIKEDEIILEEMNNIYEVLSDDSYYSE